MNHAIVGLRILFDGTDNVLCISLVEQDAKDIISKWAHKSFPPLHVLTGSCLKTGASWSVRMDRVVCMHTYIEMQSPPAHSSLPPYSSGGKH